jgi:hypothetical protein
MSKTSPNRDKYGSTTPRRHTNRADDQAPKVRNDGTVVDQAGHVSMGDEWHGDPNRMGKAEEPNKNGPKKPSRKG